MSANGTLKFTPLSVHSSTKSSGFCTKTNASQRMLEWATIGSWLYALLGLYQQLHVVPAEHREKRLLGWLTQRDRKSQLPAIKCNGAPTSLTMKNGEIAASVAGCFAFIWV